MGISVFLVLNLKGNKTVIILYELYTLYSYAVTILLVVIKSYELYTYNITIIDKLLAIASYVVFHILASITGN